MKKLVFVLAVVALFVLAQVGQAANLQPDWYARIYGINEWIYSPVTGQQELVCDAYFGIPTGDYGPFSLWYSQNTQAFVRVPSSANGVTSEQDLVLPVCLPYLGPLGGLSFACDTNYDASQMQLQFWHQNTDGSKELLWTQQQSGNYYGGATVARDTIPTGSYYFRVAIVPEPTGMLGLLALCPILALLRRRSGRCD